MYTFEQLKEDVRKEAEALRVHATKEERERLSFRNLRPHHYDNCIYGQMTGDCHTGRAVDLIQICCVRYFHSKNFTGIIQEGFSGLINRLSNLTIEDLKEHRNNYSKSDYFSAIEAYILLPEAQNASLIAYLRGETETLTL